MSDAPTPPSQRKAAVVPAGHGLAWMLQALALIKMQPARLLLIIVLLQLIMGLTQVPLIGFLILLSVPALTAGMLLAFHRVAQGVSPPPSLLFVPITSSAHTGRLLSLGALMFLVGIITVALLVPNDNSLLDPELLNRIEQGDIEALTATDLDSLRSLVFAILVGLTVSGTLSYMTIPLIWFQDRKMGQALAVGLKALVVNWKPFSVLAVCMILLLVPVSIAAAVLFAMASGDGLGSMLIMAVVMLIVLWFQLVLFGTQYCSFRDIFETGRPPDPEQPDDDSQLVA